MNDWLITKYIGFVSTRLNNYRRKSSNLHNFSCVLCNDLEAHPHQGRGYIYERQGNMLYFCQYCNYSCSAANFIKKIDQNLFNEYLLEKLKNSKTPQQIDLEEFTGKMKTPVFMKAGPLKGLKKVSQLSHNDSIKIFVTNRKIPNEYHAKLFSCPNFMTWVNTFIPNKFSDKALLHDERRLVIPFFDNNKNVHALQGRSLKTNSSVKYITIILNEDVPKLYGIDTVNEDDTIIVLEGPIDAFFIKNALATAGGDLVSAIRSLPKDKVIVCFDNEPRSKETVQKMEKAIYNGYSVCIWPENFNHKDVNDSIIAGLSGDFVKHIIQTHSYKDLTANMKLSQWRKT